MLEIQFYQQFYYYDNVATESKNKVLSIIFRKKVNADKINGFYVSCLFF